MAFRKKEIDELLVKTGHVCCIGRNRCPSSVSVHHIVPTSEGGTDDIDNAIPLCPNCHDAVHGSKASGRTTRAYTPKELKRHREETCKMVAAGRMPEPEAPPVLRRAEARFVGPQLPEHFVPRSKEFEALVKAVLEIGSGKSVAITTALAGAGGFGKTTLATAFCYDKRVRKHFSDGILWVTLGQTPNLLACLTTLYANSPMNAHHSLARRTRGKAFRACWMAQSAWS